MADQNSESQNGPPSLAAFKGMRLHNKPPSNLSDDDVQSGSATGFSDGDFDDVSPPRPAKRLDLVDPVTRILDKIDAELSSLTMSQASSSTATDNTVVRRPSSRTSTENCSRPEMNGDGLSMSELAHSHKPTFSPRSSGSRRSADTGIGTGNSSYHDDGHHQRSSSVPCRDLEPGDNYRGVVAPRRSASPEIVYMNGHHQGGQSDDDKSKQGRQNGSQLEAKLIDDKFKEIMQKRKGGFLARASTDDDNQTIRTEDFCDKFQDTLVYTSDEGERFKNLEDDLHSDGGSDTDTLQQKLATLTRTPLPSITDGRSSPHPLPRPATQRPRRNAPPPLLPKPKRLVTGPGTPPVYPKPTPTSSLPRPSSRSPALKLSSLQGHGPGHASDADSVKTEDFENRFSDMMVAGNQTTTGESDLDTVTTDPIHTRVKQLLKATAKYDDRPYLRYPVTNSILKSRLDTFKDKPKPEHKSKQHVRISPQPPQYQGNDKGEDSDETLCSDKEDGVTSPRTWSGSNWLRTIPNPRSTSDYISPQWTPYNRSFSNRSSKSSSFEDSSLSKSSLSLTSLSSLSSSDKEKQNQKQRDDTSSLSSSYLQSENWGGQNFSRQVSQISSTGSGLSSITDYPETSRSNSTSESMFDDIDPVSLHDMQIQYSTHQPKEYQYSEYTGATRRRSSTENLLVKPYILKNQMNEVMYKKEKQQKKQRDLIVQEDEEEEYPFAKYTFNKKRKNSGGSRLDDAGSSVSTTSCRSSSQDSIYSVGMMNQYSHLQNAKKPLTKAPSSSSFISSSMTSSMHERATSIDDSSPSFDSFSLDWKRKHSHLQSQNSSQNVYNTNKSYPYDRSPPSSTVSYNNMYNFPQRPLPVPSPEQVLSNLGFTESHNFLPERFLRSWLDKVILSQQEEFMRRLIPIQAPPTPPVPQQQMYYSDQYFIDDNDLPPSVSAQQSGRSTPRWRQSLENIHSNVPPPPRSRIEHRKLFRRSHTMSCNSQSLSQQVNSLVEEDMQESDFSRIGPLPLQKENSFDKLKRILQTTDVQYRDRDSRRSIFASSRQQSLPLFLETLSEEEEERRRSRTPSFDKKNGKLYPSKMKTFLEEEEGHSCRASSSEDISMSDSSRRSSFTQDPVISSMLNSVRESLSAIETTDATESDSTTSSKSDKQKRKKGKSVARKHSGINIPSIVVSERDIFNNDDAKASKEKVKEEKQFVSISDSLPPIAEQKSDQVVVVHTPVRPASPTPDKSNENIKSKDSLEIDEIMNTPDKKCIQKNENVSNLDTTKLTSGGNRHGSDKRRNSGNSKFLSITAEHDEKMLSPTPSTASPVVMSPVTVIEVNKLDNQNDSLDFEESKTSDSVDKLKIIETQFQKDCMLEDAQQTANKLPSRLSSLSQTPKSLSLERRSYEHDPNCDNDSSSSLTDTEDVFVEQLEEDGPTGHTGTSVQTENEGLPPLIKLSEMSTVLNCLFSKLPAFGQTNVFYLAQDKGIQCELPSVTAPTNDDVMDKKEKVVIEAEVENKLVSVDIEADAKEIYTDELNMKCIDHDRNNIAGKDHHFEPIESRPCSCVCHCAKDNTSIQRTESWAAGQLSYISEVCVYPKMPLKPVEKVRSETYLFLQQYSTDYSDSDVNGAECKSEKTDDVKERVCHVDNYHVDNGHVDNGHVDNGDVDNGDVDNGDVDNGDVDNGDVDNGHVDNGHVDNGHVDNGHVDNGDVDNDHDDNCHVNICHGEKYAASEHLANKCESNDIRNIVTESDIDIETNVCHESQMPPDSAHEYMGNSTLTVGNSTLTVTNSTLTVANSTLTVGNNTLTVGNRTLTEQQSNHSCTLKELARDEIMKTETKAQHVDIIDERYSDIEQTADQLKACHSEITFSFGTEPSCETKSKEACCDITANGLTVPNGGIVNPFDEPATEIDNKKVPELDLEYYNGHLRSNHFDTIAQLHEHKKKVPELDLDYNGHLRSNQLNTIAEIHEHNLYSCHSPLSCNDEAEIFEFTPVQKPCDFHSACDDIHLTMEQAKLEEKYSSHVNITMSMFQEKSTTMKTNDSVANSAYKHDETGAFQIPVVKVNNISDDRETDICEVVRVDEMLEIKGYHEPLLHEETIGIANRLDGKSSMPPSIIFNRKDADVNGENIEKKMPSVNSKSSMPPRISFNRKDADTNGDNVEKKMHNVNSKFDLSSSSGAVNVFYQDKDECQNKEVSESNEGNSYCKTGKVEKEVSKSEEGRCKTWTVDKTSTIDSWSSDGSRTIFNSEKEIVQSFSDTSWTLSARSRSSEEHELEQMDTVKDCTSRCYHENFDTDGDSSAQKTSKSLDFDARGMRRSLLQRCKQSVFGQTFDVGTDLGMDDFGQTFDVGTDLGMDDPYIMLDDAPVERKLDLAIGDFSSMGMNPVISSAFKPEIQTDSSLKETSDTNAIGEIGSNPNHGINFGTNVKERFLNSGMIENENVMYQVGLKYNKDKDCMDVFGRVKMERNSAQSSTDLDEIAREHLMGQKRKSSADEFNAERDKHETVERQDYFDIFKQIDDGHLGGADVKLAKYLSEPVKFGEFSREKEDGFFNEYVRKSSLGVDDVPLSPSNSDGLNKHSEYSNILAELDREIQQIDAYNDHSRLKYSETHRCKNCGHSLTIATSNKGVNMVEHDYCRECSPLDLTAEMLERRRLEKMEQCTHS